MPRPSNTEHRRSQIVSALRRVMASGGYDGASTAAIAASAGLAPGLLHYHFGSKEEILIALAEELGAALRGRYEKRAARAKSDWERLVALLDAHVALGPDADRDSVVCWVMLGTEALRKPDVRNVVERLYRERLAELTRLVEPLLSGSRRSEASRIAAALLSAIEGAYQLDVLGRIAPRGFAAPMLRTLARALLAEGES